MTREPQPDTQANAKTHYVIVVHGIGDQRPNETLVPVVERFAWARQPEQESPSRRELLTLGRLSSKSGERHWAAFGGIPQHGMAAKTPWTPWDQASDGGDIRFVEIYWADVMRRNFPKVGEPVATWSRKLLNKMRLRGDDDWALDIIRHLRSAVIWVRRLLKLRLNKLASKVFDDFLGDVQLYGEHPATRGAAVRHFHECMQSIHDQHTSSAASAPVYTIVAHSLGTVLSLDAILFAFARQEVRARQSAAAGADAPFFAGYNSGSGTVPAIDWVHHVRSFVTLGSPIDKYILLWAENYEYLNSTAWLDRKDDAVSIEHYNYSDEQDPVGHELNMAYRCPAIRNVFRLAEDEVYNRYYLPGVAHLGYWSDHDLFRRIASLAIDGTTTCEAHPMAWFRKRAYAVAMVVAYMAIPAITWGAGWYLVSRVIAEPLSIWTLVSVAFAVIALRLIYLNIRWRQTLVQMRLQASGREIERGDGRLAARNEWCRARRRWGRLIRVLIYLAPPVWLFWSLALLFENVPFIELLRFTDPAMQAGPFMGFAVSATIAVIFWHTRRRWSETAMRGAMKAAYGVRVAGSVGEH